MTQSIKSICDSTSINLTRSPIHFANLIKSWVYQNKVAVFDYNINGRSIAFDVSRASDQQLVIEVFSRIDYNINKNFKAMGLKESKNKHFIVEILSKDLSGDAASIQISKSIIATVAQIAKWGPHPSDDILVKCIGGISPLVIVDVGANYLSDPPYTSLLRAGLCKIVGFEPQQEALNKLQEIKGENETYFPFAVGAPGTLDLNVYNYSGFTSGYKIDERTINVAKNWFSGTRLKERVSIECIALDNVPDLPHFDVLKIDIQGGELNVFRNAKHYIDSAICIITEVGFFPLYENAPTFADVHIELLGQGFLLHKFLHLSRVDVSQSCDDSVRGIGGSSQIIDGDAVYLRDYRNFDRLSVEMLKKYALLGHFVFDSKDLVVRMLESLVQRGEVVKEAVGRYADSLR